MDFIYRFEKLDVWKNAMAFCSAVYAGTKGFPREELYGLTSQIRRASVSIPVNIAEGSACQSRKEFVQFLYIALRSQYEVVTLLRLARDLDYLEEASLKDWEEKIAVIGRQVQAMINTLKGSSK